MAQGSSGSAHLVVLLLHLDILVIEALLTIVDVVAVESVQATLVVGDAAAGFRKPLPVGW